AAFNDKGLLALPGVSFSLREAEVLGVAGVTGNGQEELAQVLAGLRPAASGSVRFDGQDITRLSPLQRWQRAIGYVPAERSEVASIAAFSLVENITLNYHFDPAFTRRGVLDDAGLERLTQRILSAYNVKAPHQHTRAQHLSGGNLQKLILGRVLSRRPRFLIAHLPTHGLDVEATAFVAILLALAFSSVLFLSAETNIFTAYRAVFSYAFFNSHGLLATVHRSIFLLFCTYAFLVPLRAGLWNIGLPGQVYAGGLAG